MSDSLPPKLSPLNVGLLLDTHAFLWWDNGSVNLTPRVLALCHDPVHKDPFDRLLVAQAQVEGMALASADHVFTSYPVSLVW